MLVPHCMLDEVPSQQWTATLTDTLNNEVIAERYHVGTQAEAVKYFEGLGTFKRHLFVHGSGRRKDRHTVTMRAATEIELFIEKG